MKKLLCLLLALVMVLSLAACSDSGNSKKDKDDEEEEEEKVVDLEDGIVGTWTVNVTFTEEMLGLEGVNIEDIPTSLTFDEDGEVTMFYTDEAIELLEEKMLDAMVEYLYAAGEEEGASRDEIDEEFESEFDCSIEEFVEILLDEMDMGETLRDLEESYTYEIEDGKLIIDDTEMTAEIKGKKLTITEVDGDFWEGSGLETPIVLKRAD